ncbi:MAG: UDP-3-O-[3-hydroxymyristoyl] N-acetylglucosamine deacetylase [Caulobacterales bacterium 32-69-10]|nr:MAG: UDP-3-O-[3-hydroxymyristoyl] N-acetylglucosamine deacetylase [Caulobacterales bacterium 32-69-10]
MLQHTLAGPAVFAGVGVHSGRHVRVAIRPAPAGHGIVFVRGDLPGENRIPISADAVVRTQLNTEIGAGGVTVSTVEHLLAALSALSVDNAVIELDGPELPIMDGSAAPFIKLIDQAGRRTLDAPRRYIEILETIEVVHGDKRAALSPNVSARPGLEVDFEIAFASRAIGRQRITLRVDESSFRRELASARTFGFVHEVEALRARGLAQAGGLENAVVVDGDRVLNPEGLRFPDEFVRHKALDAVGDLYILGAPVSGRFEGRYAGHAMNNALVRELVARPDAWRERIFAADLAQAV